MNKKDAIKALKDIFETTRACDLCADDVVENSEGQPVKEGIFFSGTREDGTQLLYGQAVDETDVFETVPVLRISELDSITYSQVDPSDEDSIDIYFELSGGQYRVHYNHTKLDCGEVCTSYEVLLRNSKRWVHGGVAIQVMRELAEEGPSNLPAAVDGLVERCLRDRAPSREALTVLERCLRGAALEGEVLAASQYVLTTLLCSEASDIFDMDLALTFLGKDRVLHVTKELLYDTHRLTWSSEDLAVAAADLEAAALSSSLGGSYQMSPLWNEPQLERFMRAELHWRTVHESAEEGTPI